MNAFSRDSNYAKCSILNRTCGASSGDGCGIGGDFLFESSCSSRHSPSTLYATDTSFSANLSDYEQTHSIFCFSDQSNSEAHFFFSSLCLSYWYYELIQLLLIIGSDRIPLLRFDDALS